MHSKFAAIAANCSNSNTLNKEASLLAGSDFGECKELNRARPPKVMGLKKKIIVQYPHSPLKKNKINMFHVSISK